MSQLPYMPLWIGDLLGDTNHLSNAEFGAYLRVLCALWRHGGYLPDDDGVLKRAAHSDPRNWPRLREMLDQFLTRPGDGRVTQKRLLAAHSRVLQKRTLCVDAAQQRWHKADKPLKKKKQADADAYADAYADASDPHMRTVMQARTKRTNLTESELSSGSPLTPHEETGYVASPSTDGSLARSFDKLAPSPPPRARRETKQEMQQRLAGWGEEMRRRWDEPSPEPEAGGLKPLKPTAFLQAWEKYQQGDSHAIDPLPGVPDRSANPHLTAIIRKQLGLDYSEEDLDDEEAAVEDDGGKFREPEQPQAGSWSASGQAGSPDHHQAPSAQASGAEHPDPGKPFDAPGRLDDDDDFMF